MQLPLNPSNLISSSSNLSELSDVPLTLSNLDLSPLREVKVRSKSKIEREQEFVEDPNYSPPLLLVVRVTKWKRYHLKRH